MKEINDIKNYGGVSGLDAKIIILILVSIVLILITLTSCKFDQITDLIHKDTESLQARNAEMLTDDKTEKYQIEGILFIPYIRQNPFETYEDKYYCYSLRLAAYKLAGEQKVVVNCISIEGVKDVNFNKVTKEDLNIELEFSEDKSNELQSSEIVLIEEINDYDMELNNKSQLKVILNITVEENGQSTTKDLEYIFGTRIRKYLVQR